MCIVIVRPGNAEDLVRTLQINANQLGLSSFLRDADAAGVGCDSVQAKKSTRQGEKWKAGYKSCCERLGSESWQVIEILFLLWPWLFV